MTLFLLYCLYMSWFRPTTALDKIFEVGLLLKGINGTLELLGGFLLLFLTPERLQHYLHAITQETVSGEKPSKILELLFHSIDTLSTGSRVFLIVYLWVHAAIKLIAVIGILKNQLWAYPFSLITLGVLTLFQVISIIHKVSLGMIVLTVFDIFILWLIWREYGKAKIEFGAKLQKTED
jgi:uncharacterized membrane protein